MKKLPLLLFLLVGFMACRQENPADQRSQLPQSLSIHSGDQPEWEYKNLKLFPILATEEFIRENTAAAELKTMTEAIDTYGFRISEKKPYGRFEDSGAVNRLTVQNKTDDPVFLMSGDIVQGGRQDRVVGEDQIIAARSLQDIPVFCVEQGRWRFEGEAENDENIPAKQGKVFAFSGYYHVAAGDIRQTLAQSKDQQEVWEQVNRITSQYELDNQTGAYDSLEDSEDFTEMRNAYLRFFEGKFNDIDNMVGIMAVSGKRIIGTDVFGHPDLFHRQLNALLHSYATDAVLLDDPPAISDKQLLQQEKHLNQAMNEDHLSRYKGALVHYFVPASPQ